MVDTLTQVIQPRSRARATGDSTALNSSRDAPSPDAAQILASLEGNVVGQQIALRELSLLLAMHALGSAESRAPNAIVLGPTGVGKTHSLSVASHAMGLPFVATDATSLVPSGIVGEQVEDVLESLVRAADGVLSSAGVARRRDDDLRLAEHGVILVDEFDKLAAYDDDDSHPSRQAERRVIQRRLLKLAEGARLRVGIKHHEPTFGDRTIDTSGILLVASGAFSGLTGSGWATSSGSRSARTRLEPADIVDAGFIPELVGRLPVLITFDSLSAGDLVGILDHDVVSPLTSWRRYFDKALQARLHFDESAKWAVAERAAALGLGARGLQHVLFPVLTARASGLVGTDGQTEVLLAASDFMPETIALPSAQPVH